MNKVQQLITLFLLFICSLEVRADIEFERYTIENGLSNNVINCIFQDKNGFLWIGTNKGLNRYDGYVFKLLSFGENEEDVIVTAIFQDSNNIIWAFTGRVIYKINLDNELVKKYSLNTEKVYHSNERDFPEYIFEDQHKCLWVTSYFGTYRYNEINDLFVKVDTDRHRITTQCYGGNNIYLGTYAGKILKLDDQTNNFEEIEIHKSIPKTSGNCHIVHMELMNDSTLLIATRLQIYALNLHSRDEIEWLLPENEFMLRENEIHDIKIIGDCQLWIGTFGNGIIISDKLNNKKNFQYLPNQTGSISNNNVNAIFRDKDQVLWVGTQDGLNKYNPSRKLFAYYAHDPHNKNSLPFNFVSGFSEDREGNIWIATHGGGISYFNPEKETFINYRNTAHKKIFSGNIIRSVAASCNGNVWVGSTNGLDWFNPKDQIVRQFYTHRSYENCINVMSLAIDHKHRLWVGTYNEGLATIQLDKQTDLPSESSFKTYMENPEVNSLSNNIVRIIKELEPEKLYIGTYGGGLNILDTETRQFTGYRNKITDPSSISNDNIDCIHKDAKGRIWIGTWYGLNLFDTKSGTFRQYYEKDGLIDNKIVDISSYQDNRLWISTINGLCSVELDENNNLINVVVYSHRNGLQGNYFCTGASIVSQKGVIYFGGSNGFNLIDEKSLHKELTQEIIYTNMQCFNKDVPVTPKGILRCPIYKASEIFLSYSDQIVSFEFSVLNSSINESLTYYYQLEGVDKTWVPLPQGTQKVSYSNLPVGNNCLKVKAQNIFGNWTKEKTLFIQVSPPFWKTIWAYLLYIIITISLFVLVTRYLYNRKKTKYELEMAQLGVEKEREMSDMKLSFFTNISHEFKTPLTLIMAALEKLDLRDSIHKQIVYQNAYRMRQLIEQLIDFRRIETSNICLEAEETDLVEFAENIKRSFDDLAGQLSMRFDFNTNISACYVWIDRDKMEKVVYNLLSNAFKYTPAGEEISISIIQETSVIKLVVKDSGVGIDAENLPHVFERFFMVPGESKNPITQSSTGIGLSLCKGFVELHHARIELDSEKGKGSTFTIYIHPGDMHLKPEEKKKKILGVEDFSGNPSVPVVPAITHYPLTDIPEIDKDKETILVVEDNNDIRYLIVNELKNKYQVIEANDGETGFDKAVTYLPDLIISDIMMPNMNGIELCSKVKNTNETSHITVLLLTAKADPMSIQEGYETGADYYIPKPFDLHIFLLQVENIMSTRRSQQTRLLNSLFAGKKELVNEETEEQKIVLPTNSRNQKLLADINRLIKENLSDSEFGINTLASRLNLSNIQFYRKMKSITGMPPSEFLQLFRLDEAYQLIRSNDYTIAEIAYKVGFNDPLYFSKCFKKQFGSSPSKIRK